MTSNTGNSFIWYKNGVALTGATSLNPYLASSSGSYTVANTNGACSTLSDPVNVTATNSKSYEVTNSVNIQGITTEAQLRVQTPGSGVLSQSIVYLDNIGRPLQEIATANSPLGKDILFHHEYNNIGLESKRYLPFVVAQSNGMYYTNPVGTSSYINSPHYLFYNDSGSDPTKKIPDDTNPFIQTVLEKSPLARVLEQGGTGSLYQPDLNTPSNGKTTKLAYASNAVNEVFKWAITDNGNLNYSLTRTYYPANVLNVTITTDAHGLQTKTYTNSYGQTIMSRLQRSGSTWADTYYVYDGYGNLRFILPPEAINQININEFSEIGTLPGDVTSGISSTTLTSPGNGNQYIYETTATITLGNGFSSSPGFEVRPFHKRNATLLNRYAYQYVYDNLNRKIAEKGPENDWSYFIFDKYNRLVLSQNPNQRATNEWSFTKYDLWDRPVLSGATTIAGSVETIRQAVANSTVMYESRGSVVHGYTNNAYPNVSDENSYLIVTYYDDYSFKSLINGVTAYHYKNNDLPGQPVSEYTRIKGSNTGSKTRVIGQNSWLWSVAYYDDRGRSIQTISANHKGGTDRVSMLYNFSGKVLSTKHSHAWESKFYSVRNDFEYDNAGRLLRKYHQIGEDPGTRVLLNAFEYNELGQLITKKLHSSNGGSTFLQTVQLRSN
ncbi:MAG: hypothetical protein EBU52_18445, partial [Cytophagia bacterium]|nr:hypothetical protein [Cytophagia bacterium]